MGAPPRLSLLQSQVRRTDNLSYGTSRRTALAQRRSPIRAGWLRSGRTLSLRWWASGDIWKVLPDSIGRLERRAARSGGDLDRQLRGEPDEAGCVRLARTGEVRNRMACGVPSEIPSRRANSARWSSRGQGWTVRRIPWRSCHPGGGVAFLLWQLVHWRRHAARTKLVGVSRPIARYMPLMVIAFHIQAIGCDRRHDQALCRPEGRTHL